MALIEDIEFVIRPKLRDTVMGMYSFYIDILNYKINYVDNEIDTIEFSFGVTNDLKDEKQYRIMSTPIHKDVVLALAGKHEYMLQGAMMIALITDIKDYYELEIQ